MLFRTLLTQGVGIVVLSLGLLNVYLQSSSNEWIDIIERLGIPGVFLLGILYLMGKAGKTVWPFIKSEVERLISVPIEVIEYQRVTGEKHRKEFTEILEKQIQVFDRAIDSLTVLHQKIDALLDTTKQKEVKKDD